MKNYNLFNEITIKKEIDDIKIEDDGSVKNIIIIKEEIIKTSRDLIKYIKSDYTDDDYYYIIYSLEELYNCKFDDIYIDDNIINQIKELLKD